MTTEDGAEVLKVSQGHKSFHRYVERYSKVLGGTL